MDDREQKIKQLKEYFEKREDVVLAFLFESQAKDYARRISDWDIGVYLKQENREKEHKIWGDIENIVQSEVDLIVLNRASATIAWAAVRGIPLAIKDRRMKRTHGMIQHRIIIAFFNVPPLFQIENYYDHPSRSRPRRF